MRMHNVPSTMKEIAGLTFSDLFEFNLNRDLLAVVTAS